MRNDWFDEECQNGRRRKKLDMAKNKAKTRHQSNKGTVQKKSNEQDYTSQKA